MKSRIKYLWVQLFALLFMVSVAHAQTAEPVQPVPVAPVVQSNFSQPELDQMLAPIALYPDGLLSQVLMASTYPNDVVDAARWSRTHPGYKGEAAVNAVAGKPWDISVKSLLPFPQVLSTMSSKIDWTERLGRAFIGQEQQVMDTIQNLRQKAMAAGYLRSDQRIRVTTQDQLVVIEPVSPTAIYVPYYNPTVVYGPWWAPGYAPVYWDPWPGYAVAPGYYGWAWSPFATVVTLGLIFGAFDWHRHDHYVGGRSGGATRWTRDSRRPFTRVSSRSSLRTSGRTTSLSGARTGTRSTTLRSGTRTGVRSTTGTRAGARSTTGTRTTVRSTTTRSTATVRSGAGATSRTGGGGRAGSGAHGGGHDGKRD